MNSKTLGGAVVGGIALFLMGYIIYGLLMADYFATSISSEAPNFPFLIIGELLFGYILTWAFTQNGTSSVSDGAKNGAMVGLFLGLAIGMVMLGTTTLSDLTHYLADAVVWAVRYAVAGAAVGWWLGRDS
jgi:hypothetical protein